jgi:hypothetical protein
MSTDTDNWRIVRRDEIGFDLESLRVVATVPITRGPTIRVLTNGHADIFWVDDPGVPVVVCFNTIRQAFSHAVKNAGWG